MSERGFTLVELLVASLISLMIAAGAFVLADAARVAVVVEPATMDTVRRLREGVDTLAAAVASAGGERSIGSEPGSLADGIPVLMLRSPDDDAFTELVVTRAIQGGRGQLADPQTSPGGSLTLASGAGLCPRSALVCGFRDGDIAVVFDGRGHYDVFTVGSVSEALSRITPSAPLGYAYRAGAWVVEVRHERLLLMAQPDGSQTLTRVTAAGAREPILDGVTRLRVRARGAAAAPGMHDAAAGGVAQYGLPPPAPDEADPEGNFASGTHCMAARDGGVLRPTLSAAPAADDGLVTLHPADLDDGPWCPHDDATERYDADWFRLRRIDVDVQVEVLAAEFRGPAGSLFTRAGTATHDAPRWIRDRTMHITVAVGR